MYVSVLVCAIVSLHLGVREKKKTNTKNNQIKKNPYLSTMMALRVVSLFTFFLHYALLTCSEMGINPNNAMINHLSKHIRWRSG